MPVLRRLALNLDSSANIALAVASLLLLNSFAVVTLRDSDLSQQSEWGVSHTAHVASEPFTLQYANHVIAPATGEDRASSVADFMRAPVISSAQAPNLLSLDPNFLEKIRAPILGTSSSKGSRTQLSSASAPVSLPWNAVEPVRFRDNGKLNIANAPTHAESGGEDKESLTAFGLPSSERLQGWVKANAKTFQGLRASSIVDPF